MINGRHFEHGKVCSLYVILEGLYLGGERHGVIDGAWLFNCDVKFNRVINLARIAQSSSNNQLKVHVKWIFAALRIFSDVNSVGTFGNGANSCSITLDFAIVTLIATSVFDDHLEGNCLETEGVNHVRINVRLNVEGVLGRGSPALRNLALC